MAITLTDAAELLLLDSMLKNSTGENFTLKLYTAVSPAISSTSVAGDFTEATFTGYSAKTLTRTSWGTSTTVSGKAASAYAQQSYSVGASGNTLLGYYIIGATSGTLYGAEEFGSSRVVANGDTFQFNPVLTLNTE